MQIARKRSLSNITLGFFLLSHPLPTALFVTTVAIFSLRASWPHLVWSTIALIILAHLAMQCSINMMNDYCDRRMDSLHQPDKPIVRGLVTPTEALTVALAMFVIMLLLLLALNPIALLVSCGYLALGQAYNFRLKGSIYSGIVLALMFSLIPLYVFAGVGHINSVALWLVPVGFLMGAALNIANSLPDIEGDAAGGAKTLTVVLGLRRSFLVCQLLIILSAILIGVLTLTRAVASQVWVTTALLILTAISVGVMFLFFGPEKPMETRKTYYRLAAFTCFLLVGGWFLGVGV